MNFRIIFVSFIFILSITYTVLYNFGFDAYYHIIKLNGNMSIRKNKNISENLLPQANVSQEIIDKQKKLLWSNVMASLTKKKVFDSTSNFTILKTNYEEYLKEFKSQYNKINLMEFVQHDDFIQLPYPLVKKTSCAVVCSAGGLLGRHLGPFIDKHDAIFRLNYAPFKGYENDVGSRTDVRLINNVVARHMGSFWDDVYGDELLIMYHCCADNRDQPRGQCIYSSYAHHQFIKQSFLKKDIPYYALDCDMWWDANIMMKNLSDLLLPRRPVSTGFMGFLIAYSVCEVIDLFGCIDQEQNQTHYYKPINDSSYDNPMGYVYHPFLTEKLLFLGQNLLDDNLTFGYGLVRIIPLEM